MLQAILAHDYPLVLMFERSHMKLLYYKDL